MMDNIFCVLQAIEESDEEDLCALSDRWEYQKTVRRWSRKGPDLDFTLGAEDNLEDTLDQLEAASSHDSLLGEESSSHTDDRLVGFTSSILNH